MIKWCGDERGNLARA